MKPEDKIALQQHVESLLQDDAADLNAVREALRSLFAVYQEQDAQLHRLMRISDRYQQILQEKQNAIENLYAKSRRRQDKVSRISDIYQQIIQESHASLSEAATHDPLTQLANRRLIHKRLNEEVERARRGGPEFCIVMLDLDHFKPINDTHGHEAGDRILVTVARSVEEEMREYDLCGRWGGEEFLLLFAETQAEAAATIVERILRKLAQLEVPARHTSISITASAGLTEHEPPEPASETIHRADQGLYQAKQAGRNCYRIA